MTLLTTTVLPVLGPLAEKEALSTFGQLFGARGSFYREGNRVKASGKQICLVD